MLMILHAECSAELGLGHGTLTTAIRMIDILIAALLQGNIITRRNANAASASGCACHFGHDDILPWVI